jgi:GT2 family glycosyltransferase
MTVDVVVAFYRQHRFLPLLRWGFEHNKDHIARVIVVNDEPWGREPDGPDNWVALDHEHDGFGLSKSINQGIAAATTEHVLVIEGDEVLAPGSLKKTLAHRPSPGTIFFCPKRYIEEPEAGFVPPQHWLPKFYPQRDHREFLNHADKRKEPYAICSGGHMLIHRASHAHIGGFDENYDYGLHDYDYGIRWMTAYGVTAAVYHPTMGDVWHIGTNKGRELPSKESRERCKAVFNHFQQVSAERGYW